LLKDQFTRNQVDDIEESIKIIPRYNSKIEVLVEGFDEIIINDLVSFKITIDRIGLEGKREIGVPHSNSFPDLYDERIAVLITAENKIVYEANVNTR